MEYPSRLGQPLLFRRQLSPHIVLLDVWSSNAEIEITYTSYRYASSTSMPTRAAQLAAAIAMARNIMPALPRS